MGALALFLVLTGGTAWAVDGPLAGQNTVGSEDIINSEVKTGDIGDAEVKGNDLAPDSVGGGKIVDRSIKNADLGIGASSSNTIADGGIQGIDVKNDTLSGAQVNESSLGEVPFAVNAQFLEGQSAGQFAPAMAEDWHEVGAPGEPQFEEDFNGGCLWSNFDSDHNSAAFFKDPWGIVHLKGLVKASDDPDSGDGVCNSLLSPLDSIVFTLPAGYRPARKEVQATLSGSDEIGRIGIEGDPASDFYFPGEVHIERNAAAFTKAKSYLSLDGITFRAAG
jgi:hypothetical protein